MTEAIRPTFQPDGLKPPVSAAPAVNRARAGETVPVGFRVVDDAGVPVTSKAVASFRTAQVDCTTGAALSPLVDAQDAGGTALRFTMR